MVNTGARSGPVRLMAPASVIISPSAAQAGKTTMHVQPWSKVWLVSVVHCSQQDKEGCHAYKTTDCTLWFLKTCSECPVHPEHAIKRL